MTHHNLTFMIMVHELRGFAPEMMICCCSTIMMCTAMKDVVKYERKADHKQMIFRSLAMLRLRVKGDSFGDE